MRIDYSRIKGVIAYGSMSIYFRIAKNQSGLTFAVGAFVKPDPALRSERNSPGEQEKF